MSAKLLLFLGSFFGFLSVAFGAFGAHALKNRLDTYSLSVFKTGVEYQFYHAIALLFVGLLMIAFSGSERSSGLLFFRGAGLLFSVGIVIFSGSLYLLALTHVKTWGAVTPLGGVCFLAGWILLCVGICKQRIL